MAAAAAASGCAGDGCGARDPWPLHHVRHRGALRRLCTSCVLRSHPGSFCCVCLLLLPDASAAPPPLVHCSRCPAAAHLACLPSSSPSAAGFVCSACAAGPDAAFSYFPLDSVADGRRQIDAGAAKALLAATQLAAASMARAAAAARADAERKVKEASVARKRAREMLERAALASEREREREKMTSAPAAVPTVPEMADPKRKTAEAVQKRRIQSRERDKWLRFHEMVQSPALRGIPEKDQIKSAPQQQPQASNNVGQAEEMDKKGNFMGLQGLCVEEEEKQERRLPKDANLDQKVP